MTTQTKDLPPVPDPVGWLTRFVNRSGLNCQVLCNHNSVGDYRDIDPGATSERVYSESQMHAYALEAIRVSATSAPEQPNQWRALCWDLAKALNCLPSTFPDANGHLLREAKRYAALACKTCNGHGLIGGMTREGGESHDCPDCNRPGTTPQPAEGA